ncbi:MAG: histidine phosphatase family protein [Ilumatobacteraceae bacterium]
MLIVVRHGRTEINAEGRLQGRTDLGLDEVGQAQAAKVGALLHGVDRVVASPLRRAQETAAAIGLPVETDDRWIEYDYGELEGLRVADVPPEVWTGWRTDPDYAPPGGESHAAVYRRVTQACEELIMDARSTGGRGHTRVADQGRRGLGARPRSDREPTHVARRGLDHPDRAPRGPCRVAILQRDLAPRLNDGTP